MRALPQRALGLRVLAMSGVAAVTLALAACSSDITTVDQAQAQIAAKQKAVDTANEEFAAASATFCANATDYVVAIDRYGDVLHDTAPTVGDVEEAGTDLLAPRDDAFDGAEDAVAKQEALLKAEQELADAETTLARIEAGVSGTPSPVASPNPTLSPLAPVTTVDRVKQAEKDFTSTQQDITAATPLTDAAEEFKAAALGLELAWMSLFVDGGCATDEQIANADKALGTYVLSLQQDLADAGYYKGTIDGIYGPQTTQAVADLQKANDLPETGKIDKATAEALQGDLVEKGVEEAGEELVTTAAVQQTLKLLGFWDGPIDGVWSDELTDAVKDLQKELGVEETGEIDAETLAAWEKALEEVKNPSPSPTPSSTASPSPSA
jgi:peptidoglycan hydrolase-like protein with peptidoglycan-binding domain